MCALHFYVNLGEEVVVHEITVALFVRAVKADVLVKVEGAALREGEPPRGAEAGQLGVEAERRGAGGQTEHGVRFCSEKVYITLSCLGNYFFLGADDNFNFYLPR